MKHFLIALIISMSLDMDIRANTDIDTNLIVGGCFLSRPTTNQVTLLLSAKVNIQIYYKYGSHPATLDMQSDIQTVTAGSVNRTIIGGLQPDNRYYYRLCYKPNLASVFSESSLFNFSTARSPGKKFKSGLLADSHLYDKKGNPTLMYTTLQNLAADSVDFLIDMGDTFGDDHKPTTITLQELMDLHKAYIPYISRVCNNSHFFFCLGNHEGEKGYYLLQSPPNNMAAYATLARKYYYSNPVPNSFYSGNTQAEPYGIGYPENYYAFTWGDALFVVLDAYRAATIAEKPTGWDWTLGAEQYNWFKQVLENSTALYKFVFAHHVGGEGRGGIIPAKFFEWGGYEKNGTTWGFPSKRPGWDQPIHQLMVQHNVNIFFQGHDHLFAQEVLDSVIYQELPMPSDSSYMIGMLANADAYTTNQLSGSGHVTVTVQPGFSKVEYIRAFLPADTGATQRNGEIAFSYTVKPRTTRIEQAENILQSFAMEQNFPNPFNGQTTIQYNLHEAGMVKLSMYDLLGREIIRMHEGWQTSGSYRKSIDFNYLSNGMLPSGIYLYQLQINNLSVTKKALYLK